MIGHSGLGAGRRQVLERVRHFGEVAGAALERGDMLKRDPLHLGAAAVVVAP
jgi:hypothetical protein